MNVAKQLIKISGLSKQTSILDLLSRLLFKFHQNGDDQLKPVGILMQDKHLKSDAYLLFLEMEEIEIFKRYCFKEERDFKIALFGDCFKVKFCNKNFKMNLDDVLITDDSQLELKIKKRKGDSLIKFLEILPKEITFHMIEPKIISAIENRNCIFLKFEKQCDVEKVKVDLLGKRYEVEYSKTYTFISITEDQDQSPTNKIEENRDYFRHSRIEPPTEMEVDYDNEILDLECRDYFSETESVYKYSNSEFESYNLEAVIRNILSDESHAGQREVIESRKKQGTTIYQIALIPCQDKKNTEPIVLSPTINLDL